MRSPGSSSTIQIELTNLCYHNCANCTRHCGHQNKPFFLSLEKFQQALASLAEYTGTIGIMGGEPTLHPDFETLIRYYQKNTLAGKIFHHNYLISKYLAVPPDDNRRGLWTSLGDKYYQHFEIIQETFGFQVLNDHQNATMHQGLLVARKDLGITDEEWTPLRDNCWIQNMWSASITPKGAFFCEVAAALDWLFGGPGGWPVEPGWWKREPKDFGDQLQWCELCSAALPVPALLAIQHKDIISPTLLEKLHAIGSRKVARGQYHLLTRSEYEQYKQDNERRSHKGTWYLEEKAANPINTKKSLLPRSIKIVAGRQGGNVISRAEFLRLDFPDWAFVAPAGAVVDDKEIGLLPEFILNPGCLYYRPAGLLSSSKSAQDILAHSTAVGCNKLALSLRKFNGSLPDDLGDLIAAYPEEKRIPLPRNIRLYGYYLRLRHLAGNCKRSCLKWWRRQRKRWE